MSGADPVLDLQAFVDEKWGVVQPTCFREATIGWRLTPAGEVPVFPDAITASDARHFLESVRGSDPFFVIENNNKVRSDRYPTLANGEPRGYLFFEQSQTSMGGLRLETIVHFGAMARLRDEFGWPREYLVCESPCFVDQNGTPVLHQDALDILVLGEPCPTPAAKMVAADTGSCVAVEVKATAKMLDHLVAGMRACDTVGAVHARHEHAKCEALAALRPRLFLAVAANSWRLFTVVERDDGSVLGAEQDTLDDLYFRPGG